MITGGHLMPIHHEKQRSTAGRILYRSRPDRNSRSCLDLSPPLFPSMDQDLGPDATATVASSNDLSQMQNKLSCIDHCIDKRGQMGHQHWVKSFLHSEKDTGDR